MKIYMNLYGNSRFVINTDIIKLKENENRRDNSSMLINCREIYCIDILGKEHKLIDTNYFNNRLDYQVKQKYLIAIMDSLSEEYMRGNMVLDFKGLVEKAIHDVNNGK